MCARYTLSDLDDLVAAFELLSAPVLVPRFNIAPSQRVVVVGRKPDGSGRGAVAMTWGFVPHWAKSPTDGPRPVNARAETIQTSAPFRDSFRSRRCIIPADGFFEWLHVDRKKVPYLFRPRDGGYLGFAGIWEIWQSTASEPLYSCAIVTVTANATLRPYHERMPAILMPSDFDVWLDIKTPAQTAYDLLRPADDDYLQIVPIGPTVNRASNDTPECIQSIA